MEQVQPEVEIDVDLRLSDLLRANLWFRFTKPSTVFSLVTFALVTVICVGLTVIQPRPLFVVMPIALWGLEAFILIVIIVETKRNFTAAKEVHKNVRYHLKREGYTVNAGKSSADVSWESVLKAVESKRSFNVFIGRTSFLVLPKRCFKSIADIVTTRQILKSALGENAELK